MDTLPAHRLAQQRISQTDFTDPVEVVAHLGALQGQDYTGALWSVGLRLPPTRDTAIEQAFTEQRLVRTWVMRGTLHVVTGADVRWMVTLVGPKIIASLARRYKELELDSDTLHRSSDILANAVRDGQQMDRPALLALLEQQGIATTGQRAPHLLQHAAYGGLICQSTTTRNHPLYQALDDRFAPNPYTREEAIVELARRYFTSRGPATVYDFVHWSGLMISEARMALEALKGQLEADTQGTDTYWRPISPPPVPPMSDSLFLLPGFDEYILGYKDRRAVLDPQYAQRICPGGNGVFYPTIVSQGQVVGTWTRTLKKNTVLVSAQPFTALTDEEHNKFAAAAQTYSGFLGVSLVLPKQI